MDDNKSDYPHFTVRAEYAITGDAICDRIGLWYLNADGKPQYVTDGQLRSGAQLSATDLAAILRRLAYQIEGRDDAFAKAKVMAEAFGETGLSHIRTRGRIG